MKSKIIALTACAVLAFSCTACRQNGNEQIDPNKTQIYVGYYSGGLGEAWIDNAEQRFESEHSDVQVFVNKSKDLYNDSYMKNAFESMTEDVYIVDYIDYNWFRQKDYLLDITDIVTDAAGGKSIDEIIDPAFKRYYKESDGKYYGLPLYKAAVNLIYDIELFEKEQLYFTEQGKWTGDKTKASKGKDGESGTSDDGLPVTTDDFKKLMDRMVSKGITPFIYTGDNQTYYTQWLFNVWSDHEGYDATMLNYTLDGEYTFAGDSEPTKITYENAYLLQKQQGRKHALDVMELMFSNSAYYDTACFDLVSQTTAQAKYLMSSQQNKPIAMLIDGPWWETEAKAAFNSLVSATADANNGYGKRRYGLMTIPSANDGNGKNDDTYFAAGYSAAIFIRKNSSVAEYAKQFIKSLHTEEGMRDFTVNTNMLKPYDYELQPSDYDKLTPFGKECIERYSKGRFVYSLRYNDYMKYTQYDVFQYMNWPFASKVKGSENIFPQEQYKLKGYTVDEIFQGLYDYYDQTKWAEAVKTYKEKYVR